MKLLTPQELDELLRYPKGKSQRLARRNLIPHITLPDGSIRFRPTDIEKLIGSQLGVLVDQVIPQEAAHV